MYLQFLNFKALKRFLRPPSITELSKKSSVMEKARTLVSYYYYVLPYIALLFVSNGILDRQNFDPFWPLLWSTHFNIDYATVVVIVKTSFVIVAALAAFLHKHTFFRILVFLAILHVHAIESSFGAINHQWYLWLYTSFIFIFLPNIWSEEKKTQDTDRKFLLFIWFAQALAMLTYSMAGLWKFVFALQQNIVGEVDGFALEAFSYQIANWVPRLQSEAILAPYVIAYPEVGWFFYVGLHFLQLFALWVMVRPSLQKIWALTLIIFHIGTYLTMGISFHPLVILIIILFFNTPFAKKSATAKDLVYDLPIVGQLLEWFARRRNHV